MLQQLKTSGFLNVIILSIAQLFAFTAIPMMMFIGSLIGVTLAPNPEYATLPIAAMIVGTAIGTVPMALLMQKFGRKPVFILAVVTASTCCFAISQTLAHKSFFLYCGFIALLGVCMAGVQQIRFAAMESVASEKAATAASMVLVGGVVAAFAGPELAILGKHFTSTDYQGSFYLVIFTFLASALVLSQYQAVETEIHTTEQEPPRPLLDILNNRSLCLAIFTAATGFAIMSFIMTATPISMRHMHGHSLEDTKWVIQSHIAFMFLPSLISPFIIRLIGLHGMIVAGLTAYVACIFIATQHTEVWAFWSALVLLGVGWNFLFIAGTSMLPQHHKTSEQYKVQALNDGIIFSLQAIASLSAGFILSQSGWSNLLLLCLPFMIVLLFLLVWVHLKKTPSLISN